jgi:oligosaccharide repeat unit polymerase
MTIQRIIINPLFVFLGVWAIPFLLLRIDVSAQVSSLPNGFGFQAMLVAIGAVVGYGIGFYGLGKLRSRPGRFVNGISRLSFMIRVLFGIMCLVFLITVVVSGGIPILYYLTGSGGPSYTKFGIPTVHGFFNSLLLFVGTLTFWMLIYYSSRRWIRLVFLICLAIPIITVHRASLMFLITQCAVIYIALRIRRLNKRVVVLALLLAFIVVVFSGIGNLRNESVLFRQHAALQPKYEWIPSWALWFYMYLTTPLSNFAQITTMNFVHTSGAVSFSDLTPTVVRRAIWGEPPWIAQEVGAKTFNVASYALSPYIDWGWAGVICFTGFILMLAGYFFRTFLCRHSLYDLLRLSVLLQVIIMTVFANLFLTWGVIFQFVLALLFRRWLIRIDALAGLWTMHGKNDRKEWLTQTIGHNVTLSSEQR